MKSLSSLLLVGLLPLVMIACGKSGDSNNNAPAAETTAATPLTTDCLTNPSACNPNGYSPYWQHGFSPYPFSHHFQQYYTTGGYVNYWTAYATQYGYPQNQVHFCDCPSGAFPVYHNSFGLGCYNGGNINPYYGNNIPVAGFWGFYSLGYSNNQWINTPQISNIANTSLPSSCYRTTLQACWVSSASNTCGTGYTCRPTTQNAPIGICTAN